MSVNPSVNLTIHVNDETKMEAQRVNSSGSDFVSVKMGFPIGILLFTKEQASALIEAAEEAYYILRTIEDEEARAARAKARAVSVPVIREVDPELERLLAEEEEIERRQSRAYDIERCTISNPCKDCLDAGMYDQDDYEPF